MAAILFVLSALVWVFWNGYVTSNLWLWFMVPLGVKAITYWHAVGLAALLSSFLSIFSIQLADSRDDESFLKMASRYLMLSVSIPSILFIVGWLAKINL